MQRKRLRVMRLGLLLKVTMSLAWVAGLHGCQKSLADGEAGTGAKGRDEAPVYQEKPRATAVTVSVHLPGGAHYQQEATVKLERAKRSVVLKRREGSVLYGGKVEPGTYRVIVSAQGWSAPDRFVEIGSDANTVSVYLGKPDWPFYRLGKNIVPFQPREDLLAVAFGARKPAANTAAKLVRELQDKLPLEPLLFEANEKEELPFTAAEGAIWLFRLTEPDARQRVSEEIRRHLGRLLPESDVRVGMPVDLIPGQVKVLDNRFVIRFRDHLTPKDIDELAKAANARILRGFIQAGNARLIEFQRGTYREHLKIVEQWIQRGLLVYGEPDLLAEITDDQFPCVDPPNDPLYGTQANLTLQDVDDAWCVLNGVAANLTLGSPNVYVATLDRGVQTGHTDIGGNLTDGTAQLAQCYDFSDLRACTVPGYTPDTSHGMGVYGIIAAITNNDTAIAGIAPNTHQIGIERPDYTDATVYPDALLWAAGFTTANTSAGWPAEPISPAADIISCSHGANGLALSGIMDDTLTYLATYGRGGRGTLMIYSAGNGIVIDGERVPQLITGFRTWAAHPRTMGISNSNQPDAGGVERLNNTSNFGPEIDICAQGNGAPSLNAIGGTRIFSGTSAAAPTVAAAAALMLSAEPTLTWIDLRDILRNTAIQIDPANTDPVGLWVGGFSQWYGFGRLDVDNAVQGAMDFNTNAVNLLARDNLTETGWLLPTGGTFYRSPDLWVRNSNPATDPIGDPAYGVAPPNEPAVSGADNWIRVRVKNVGTSPSSNFYVRVYLTHFAGSQFQYPTDYIPSVNSGAPLPPLLVQATYLIGETLVPSLSAGTNQIFDFLWPSAMVPPETVGGTKWHPCLLAEVSPHTGPAPTGNLVTDNTNLAQRNVTVVYSDDASVDEITGVIGHEDDDSPVKRIVVHRGNLPKNAKIWVRFLDPRVEAAVVDSLAEAGRRPGHPKCCECYCCEGDAAGEMHNAGEVVVDRWQEHRVFRLASGSRLVLHVPMAGGRLTPVVLGAVLPKGTPKGSYELPLVEQDSAGHILGAFAMEIVVR